jgi:hypothetical protein
VDDRPQRAVIRAHGGRAGDERRTAAAAGACREGDADDAPRRQRIPAAIAKRRGERQDRAPAGAADRPAGRVFEQLSARRARGRQDDGKESVCSRAKVTYRPSEPRARARRCPRAARARRRSASPA